jgi:thioester reductase-like protein
VQLVSHAADLARSDFGLTQGDLFSIREEVTHIIHSAWPVNFTLNLATFEPHVQGLHNLLQLSLDAQARLFFCSSVSAALATSAPATIAEAPIQELSQALPSGYGRSKLVSEHVLLNAVTLAGADAQILRIGQVVGDTKSGIWNDNEAWPLIIRSALTLGVLPELDLVSGYP